MLWVSRDKYGFGIDLWSGEKPELDYDSWDAGDDTYHERSYCCTSDEAILDILGFPLAPGECVPLVKGETP